MTFSSADRRHGIIAFVRHHGRAEVTTLAGQFEVTNETVRRDLVVLEQQGFLRRSHGTVYPVDNAGYETTMEYRSTHLVPEKRRIAAAAIESLAAADTVYLDDGFTPQVVAEGLARIGRPLTVITPSIPIAAALARSRTITVIALGGWVRPRTLGTVGHWVSDMLAGMVIDVAFIGTNGISRERGLTIPDPSVYPVKSMAMSQSRRRIFIGVHTKFGVDSFVRFAGVSDFELLITDRGLSSFEAKRYAELGPKVLRV